MGLSLAKAKENNTHIADQIQQAQPDEGDVDLSGHVVIENIHIDGVIRTDETLLKKQLQDVFDAKTFEETIERSNIARLRLQRLGIFKGVEVFIDISRNAKPHPRGLDVHFMVEESKRLTASAGTSVGNNEGSMVLGFRLNNIRGKAETVKADASIGSRVSSSYELGMSKPLFFNADTKAGLRTYRATTEYSQSMFKEYCHGVTADVTVPSPVGMHTFALDGVWRENAGMTPKTPFSIREMAGHNLKTSFKHSFVTDGRDDWILPSAGNLFKHTLEFASPSLLGSCHFIKSEGEVQVNRSIFEDVVVGCTAQCGVVTAVNGQQLPINDKYFLGGPLSLRGFQMKSVGPRDGTAALGGNAYVAGGMHLYTPLPFRPGKGGFGDLFRLHFFANAGNLVNMDSSLAVKDNVNALFRDFRWSYGIGVMFMLGGVARLELNYCIPKNAQPGDGISPGLQAGVGMSFL